MEAGYQPASKAIGLHKPSKGLEITTKDGTTIRTGVLTNQPGGLTKPVKTQVQKDMLKAGAGVERLTAIEQSFDPKYLELGTRWGAMATKWKEKAGFKPSPKEKKELENYSEFRRKSISNLNQYIREITGAQMSEGEAARLVKGMPNPGMGLFDGDSHSEFRAKMDGVVSELKRASARYHYVNKYGMEISDVPLEKMPDMMNKRAQAYETEIKSINPNIGQGDLVRMVKQKLADDFGLIGN